MRKVFVVGFDGATWRFIRPLVERGEMPNFQRLMADGVSGELTSVVPFQSAAAWVTFMTGKNSGKHGVYMFQDYDALSYTYAGRTANSRYFSGQTIFDIVGELGGTVAAIRVPLTYPAWPINGIMVSGFPTPGDTPESFHPPELRAEVGSAAQPDEDPDFRKLTVEQQAASLETQMRRMSELVARMIDRKHDLFMVVHRVPDPVHHFFIKFVDSRTPAYNPDDTPRWGDLVNRFYRKMDEALGETLAALSEDDTIFVISDHGGAITPPRQFNVNVWLAERGWLTPHQESKSVRERVYALNQQLLPSRVRSVLRRHAPRSVRGELRQMWRGLQHIDFPKTQAYHFPMKCSPLAGININVRGRQPNGVVDPEEYERLRDRILAEIRDVKDPKTGERIVLRVYKREELYDGPFVERAPDIVVWCNDMYREGPFARGPMVSEVPFDELLQVPGAHDEKGIFLARGPLLARSKTVYDAKLIDLTPTILHAMELPVPSDMDGRVLTEIFNDSDRDVESVELDLTRKTADSYLSADEEQLIKDKLKGWGYL